LEGEAHVVDIAIDQTKEGGFGTDIHVDVGGERQELTAEKEVALAEPKLEVLEDNTAFDSKIEGEIEMAGSVMMTGIGRKLGLPASFSFSSFFDSSGGSSSL
jgi:hypothetical protein